MAHEIRVFASSAQCGRGRRKASDSNARRDPRVDGARARGDSQVMPPSKRLKELAVQHHAFVSSDNVFQRRARLLQAVWRESKGLPIGEHRGRPLGSRLAMPQAKEQLLNYLSDTIRDVVRREVIERNKAEGKLYGEPRIFNDLLSSQPLCFNLFGELQQDLELASRVLGALTGGRTGTVTAIQFEHSPGRGDPRFTGDRSAFDVYVEHTTPSGVRGFVGIEVKYHEGLGDKPALHRSRYDEIADAMGAFEAGARDALMQKPLQQIWRDHLLAGSLRLDDESGFGDGLFVFLHPARNERCVHAVQHYRECLTDGNSFTAWTLEDVVAAIEAAGAGAWIGGVEERYLAFDLVNPR